MQCTCEQQKGEHPLHQNPGEIDRSDQLLFEVAEGWNAQLIQTHERARQCQRDTHYANCRRQTDESLIDVGK